MLPVLERIAKSLETIASKIKDIPISNILSQDQSISHHNLDNKHAN